MSYSRLLWLLVGTVLTAGCSGNLGGGQSTLPGVPQGNTNLQQVAAPAPTASPVSASNIATIGDSVGPQALPAVMGWTGTIAFPNPSAAPSASPNPKATPAATEQASSAISIGVTAAVVEPSDAPRLRSADGKDHRSSGKHADPTTIKGLFFISLLSTADVTLGEYPKIAVDVPREVAAKYRDDVFALALYDPETKAKAYRLAVAERDLASPVPGSVPVPTATPTVVPVSGPSAGFNAAFPFTPPPVGPGMEGGSLPPEHVAFLATAAVLNLKANRPVVFALYAQPAQPSPSPTATTSSRPASPLPGDAAAATAPPTVAPIAAPSPIPSSS